MAKMTEAEKEEWRRKHNEELQSRTKDGKRKAAAIARMERAEQVRKMNPANARRIADKDEVAAYYTEVMRDEMASYGERTSAAMQLQRLQGWEKVQLSEGAGDIAAFFLALRGKTSSQKPIWQKNAALPDPNIVDLHSPKEHFSGNQEPKYQES